ncbi:MAG TPA: Fe-S cluster assembly protein SufB [Candidatus Nanoarchaeia archaeon]|nr:Fe-S cluster assembly protein SufB [Candidatus Nanoarchaeia archaeon]
MPLQIEIDRSNYDDHIEIENEFTAEPGLSESLIRFISEQKKEPEWMLKKRLQGLELFNKTPLPKWGPSLSALDLNKIIYYVKPGMKEATRWEDLPEEIRKTAERIGIPEAEKHSLSGAGFQFDCLTEDSLIHTNPRGPVEIKNIKPGDVVFSYDENNNEIVKSKVIGVLDKGNLPVFEVKVAGRTIKATSNHPFLTLVDNRKEGRQRARYTKKWKHLNELNAGDVVAIATDLPDCGESYKFPKIEINRIIKGKNQTGKTYSVDISKTYNNISLPKESNEDIMWILGLFLGDGWISKSKKEFKKYVKFAIPSSQHSLREELINACKRVFGSRVLTSTKDWIRINSTILAHFIEEIGFEGTASTKKVPDWIMAIPKNEKLAFLGGYLDSDGTVRNGKKSKDVVYTSVNEKILEKVKQICFYCGLQTSKVTTISTSYHYKGKTEKKILHRLHVSGNTLIIKSRYEFKRERLENKKQYSKFRSILETNIKAHTSNSVGLAKIESIIPAGIQHVYDISVENYRNFVAEGIVVHNSDMAYHNLKKEWEDQGVIFENMDVAVKKYPELVKKYFMTSCIPVNDHKFIMLHSAVWSGGTFIYIPENVKVQIPLQAYFRMNALKGGQFEHTLIIADKNSEVHYIEGCSSPVYSSASLHAGCVEIHVLENARVRYSSVENWSKNTYNLNTKRALVHKNAIIEWVNGNMGSICTMLYPCSVLVGEGAKSDSLGIAFAAKGQNQDTGSKVIHAAPNTSSVICSKSISKNGGITSYRGLVKVMKNAINTKSSVNCDALLIDEESVSNTFPTIITETNKADISHEASVGKIGEEEIFYLMSRGLSKEQAIQMVVSGFIEPIVKQLPLEYAVELNKLIELEMEGTVG